MREYDVLQVSASQLNVQRLGEVERLASSADEAIGAKFWSFVIGQDVKSVDPFKQI